MKRYQRSLGPALLALLAACDPQRLASPPAQGVALMSQSERDSDRERERQDRTLLPLSRFVLSDDDACESREYRAFDFWEGRWNVSETGKTDLFGTNVVSKGIHGCVMEEHWSDLAGVRGRSLNAYDASTRTWNQLWMDQTGGALQLGGVGDGRRMQMAGTHQTSRFDPTPQTDRISWSVASRDVVRQIGELAVNGGAFSTLYDLTYRGVRQEAAIAPSALAFCASPARPRFHAFDFLLGSWNVARRGSEGVIHTNVSTDLGGCLVEERMSGPRGFEAVAYSGFRSATFVWNWMYMDNRGVQLQLSGPATLTGTTMTLSGTKRDRAGTSVNVRLEWVMLDSSTVEQRWSFSTDGGATWSAPDVLTMSK